MEKEHLSLFISFYRGKGYSETTLENKLRHLKFFMRWLQSQEVYSFFSVTEERVREYELFLFSMAIGQGFRYLRLESVYSFYRWQVEQGCLLISPYPKSPKSPTTSGVQRKTVEWSEIRNACEALKKSKFVTDQRNGIIFELAFSCGLRKEELTRLSLSDISSVEQTIRVWGKGSKERFVPVGRKMLAELQRYISSTRVELCSVGKTRGNTEALFISRKKRMTLGAMGAITRSLRRRYGIDRKIRLHTMRHSFATALLRNGAPIQDVSKMLGHSFLSTTQIYTDVVKDDLKKVHCQYHPRG